MSAEKSYRGWGLIVRERENGWERGGSGNGGANFAERLVLPGDMIGISDCACACGAQRVPHRLSYLLRWDFFSNNGVFFPGFPFSCILSIMSFIPCT